MTSAYNPMIPKYGAKASSPTATVQSSRGGNSGYKGLPRSKYGYVGKDWQMFHQWQSGQISSHAFDFMTGPHEGLSKLTVGGPQHKSSATKKANTTHAMTSVSGKTKNPSSSSTPNTKTTHVSTWYTPSTGSGPTSTSSNSSSSSSSSGGMLGGLLGGSGSTSTLLIGALAVGVAYLYMEGDL